jgi:DNA-binding transcriptional LysR family regulator
MEQFIISPDDCLILRAYKDATSLREAARLLNCDPAGLQRKTQRISEEHGLLQKIKGKWGLTEAGSNLVGWLEESIATQKKVLVGNTSVRIASTMWLAEEFLIPNLLDLRNKLGPNINFQLTTPDKNFETHLTEGACDFVIVCHPPEDPAIAHRSLFKEEWAVVAPAGWKSKGHKLSFDELLKKPFVRHEKINPDIFHLDAAALGKVTALTVNNLIANRSAVLHGLGWSIVPKILVLDLLKSKQIVEVEREIEMDRKMCVWWLRRRTDSKKLSTSICQFIQESYSKIS